MFTYLALTYVMKTAFSISCPSLQGRPILPQLGPAHCQCGPNWIVQIPELGVYLQPGAQLFTPYIHLLETSV